MWTVSDVKFVLKKLKPNKSQDPNGHSNELIQGGGDDLIIAITKVMNNIRPQQIYPECLQPCNLTT